MFTRKGSPEEVESGRNIRGDSNRQVSRARNEGGHSKEVKSAGNVCPTCNKTFERLYNLKVHLRKHTGETPYHCPIANCARQFKWRSSMAHHVRAHHNGTNEDILAAKIRDVREHLPTQMGMHITVTKASAAGQFGTLVRKRKAGNHAKITRGKPESPVRKKKKALKAKGSSERDSPTTVLAAECGPQESARQGADLDAVFAEFGAHLRAVEIPELETGEQLLGMVSNIVDEANETFSDSIMDIAEPVEVVSAEDSAHEMMFLAAGGEDATDADMEFRAQADDILSILE